MDSEFAFIEDPFRPDNLVALAAFRKHSLATVAIGEWESSGNRFLELLRHDLLDIARVDATAVGGITGWMRIVAVVAAHEKRVLPHYYPEIHRHLVAACPVADTIEVVPRSTGADNFHLLVDSTPWEGVTPLPYSETPGLGIKWNWEVIEQLGTK
jgi:L-alanine-DL-glutamate epimerase-like enolase superfamily enzyme